ncbi:hypothetical protein GGS20DRAFT_573167 [Poronia punctata]|nr:hypothetical protein GGS20DRAFT_573167 [Poronia punctata]
MNLPSLAAFRVLTLLTVIVVLYSLYGYFHFYRDPLSIFFSEEHGFDPIYSTTRQAEASALLDSLEANPDAVRSRLGKAGPNPQLCAIFLTAGRKMERHYVETAVASFLVNMSHVERQAVTLKLFFVDPDPETQHQSFARLATADIADGIVTYNTSLPDRDKETELALLTSWHHDRKDGTEIDRKMIHDYAYALSHCVQTTDAPYIALFEDDILLADGWAARTLKNLRTLEAMMQDPKRHEPARGQVEPGGPNSWLYLRMFNQERSFGWGGGTGFMSNNVHIISLAISIPLAAILLLVRKTALSRHIARHIDGWVILVVCGIQVPLFVWLFYASGKASLVGSRPGVYEEWFGCCNQALVYNRQYAQGLSDFLMDAAHGPGKPGRIDMIPRDFAWQHGLARISAYPMLVQHAGRISATGTTLSEATKVWSMAFEDFKPVTLARDHIRNVKEIFGPEAANEMLTST